MSTFEILLDSSIAETAKENSTLVKVKNLSMTLKDCHRDALKALDTSPELSFMTEVCRLRWFLVCDSWLYSEKEKTVIEPCINTMTECYYDLL